MPRLFTDPVTDIHMLEFLESSDFQFELDVLLSLSTRGITASHGGTYTDPVTKKDRQYDIRAEKMHGICNLRMAIECKNIQENYPLLVSRVPRSTKECYHDVMIGRANSLPIDSGFPYALRNTLFQSGQPVGKSITQVGRVRGDDRSVEYQMVDSSGEVYDKWSQAIASSYDLISMSGHSSIGDFTLNATVIIPILVIPDRMLWAVDYSKEGSLTTNPRQVESCSLYLGKKISVGSLRYTLSHLQIYTKTAFDDFLDKIRDDHSEEWEDFFPDNKTFAKYESGSF